MADRNLPLGQITPVARPIGAFVQAAQSQPAAPARPVQLDNPLGISTIQTQSSGNVAGYNQFEQLATALAPFSKSLMTMAGEGYVGLRKGQIEEGYYAELKNQRAKGMMSLQVQAEAGAADAASQIGQLQKVDPVAAQLLNESNPWKLIGRRRALAQLAGAEIENTLEDDLTANAGLLSTLKPESPELTKRQVQLTSQVLGRFQLSGDEPEVQFYVTPKLNQAWDAYREKQRKFYDDAVEESTRNTTVAATAATVEEMLTKGITINGVTYQKGSPEWIQYGGAALTYGLDQQLRLLPPDARKRTVQFLREQIIGTFGGDPLAGSLLQNVRAGDPSMPFEKRPTWGAMAPLETLELQVRGQEAAQKTYDLRQKGVEQQLDRLWYDGPGKLDPADPAYPSALLEFRNQSLGMGYLTPEEYIARRAKDQSAFTQVVRPPDPFQVDDFIVQLEQVAPGAWTDDPNSYKNALQQARQIASLNPTPEGRREDYQRMVAAINKARDSAGEFDTGVKEKVTAAVLQDLDSQAVREIKSQQKVNGRSGDALAQVVAQQLAGGATATAAISAAYQNTKLTAAANRLTNLYERALSTAIRNWKAERPGQVMSPAARSVVTAEAEAAVRKSPEWIKAMTELTGRKPGEVGQGKVGTDPKAARGVPQAGAKTLSDETIRTYQQRPVMDGRWLRSELVKLQGNKPVSPELYNLAKRANTSTYRYLLEQLRFYPALDPGGDAKRWLQEKVKQQRANNTVSSNQLPSFQGTGLGMVPAGYNPLRAGGWLMRMFTPPVAAATLDSQGGGRYGGGPFMDSGAWATGPAQPVSHPETGSGFTVPGARDANGRPVVFSQAAANSFAAMMRDSGGQVRAADIASAKRTEAKNRAVGGVGGSQHLDGNAMDIHGSSINWIRKNGARYGWYVNDYSGSHGGHVEFRGSGAMASASPTTRRGGGLTGIATYYTGSGGSDGVAGGPTANGEIYDPNKMTAAVQWSLRGRFLNKWVTVEDLDTGRSVRVWVNDVGQMGGSERSISRSDPRVIDLSPAAFRRLFGSTQRGMGRIRIKGVN
ncbi:MAG: uncultured phage MedDCM-OCT-S38-C3 [Cyanobacteriota bacterium]|jgi:hypothetical protein